MSGLVNEHCVSRSVRDSAAMLDATQGSMPGDPYVAPAPKRPYAQEVGADTGHLRIAFTKVTTNGIPLHPDCIAAVEDAAKLCQELGHEVVEDAPPIDGASLVQTFTDLWSAGNVWTIDTLKMMTGADAKPEDFEILTWALYERGLEVSAGQYLAAISQLQMLGRVVANFHQRYDVWLTPTLGQPPVELGYIESTPEQPMLGFERAAEFVPYTPLQNVTGQPAMNVPLFWNDAGLPIGTHFVGRYGEEDTLFRLAAQLEEARPWAQRRPPVSA
jgi:amidase